MAERKLCLGSGEPVVELRDYRGHDLLGKCGTCGRILKPMHHPTVQGRTLRQHSIRGKNTASYDSTMGILWDHARKVGLNGR